MTFTAADGPQATAADAYQHGADLAGVLAKKARQQTRRQHPGAPYQPVFVRAEDVEQLAAGLAARAEEARNWSGR